MATDPIPKKKLHLFIFMHRTVPAVFYGFGADPREASRQLIQALNYRSFKLPKGIFLQREKELIQLGIVDIGKKTNFMRGDWAHSRLMQLTSLLQYNKFVREVLRFKPVGIDHVSETPYLINIDPSFHQLYF